MYLFLVLHRLLSLSMIPFVYSIFFLRMGDEMIFLFGWKDSCSSQLFRAMQTPRLYYTQYTFVSLVGSELIGMPHSDPVLYGAY